MTNVHPAVAGMRPCTSYESMMDKGIGKERSQTANRCRKGVLSDLGLG